ncbi:hypothetical protein [Pontiella desulfatans]|uniref:hypothetical protein n=1 Tax=Pontiella desulfatans TaxID=2750659 RepID=UPI001443DE2D|nr:hypothetical protein [Pontiella desulfatans]
MEKEWEVHEDVERYGVDISLLRANLRLSPVERLRRHDRALTTMQKLRVAMEKKRG